MMAGSTWAANTALWSTLTNLARSGIGDDCCDDVGCCMFYGSVAADITPRSDGLAKPLTFAEAAELERKAAMFEGIAKAVRQVLAKYQPQEMQAARRLPHKPEPDQPHGLAPEIGVLVQTFQGDIERTIQVTNLSDQDLGAVLKTQAALVGLLYRMLTDHALAVSKAGLDASQILPPLLDRVDQGLRREVPSIRRAFDRRTTAWMAWLAGGALAAILGALAIGWWWGSGSVLEICRAGQVLHAADGRTYCAAWWPTR